MQLVEGRDCHVAAEATLLRMLSCTAAVDPEALAFQTYAWQMMGLLNGHLCSTALGDDPDAVRRTLTAAGGAYYDLLLLGGRTTSALLDASLAPQLARLAARGQTPSLLLTQKPSWPLRRLLLLIRGEATDAATIEWGSRLAGRSQCQVTVLVVLPAASTQQADARCPMADVLTSHSWMGQNVRRALAPLVSQQLDVVLKLNQGEPGRQVYQEVTRGNYDLTVLNPEPESRLLDARLGSLVEPLLRWSPRPLLIANPLRQSDDEEDGEALWRD